MKTLTWGIIGCGAIAKTFATGVSRSKTGKLIAVASREKSKAQAFARDVPSGAGHAGGEIRAYGSYEELLADRDVQAVYIATPHPLHAEWAIKAAGAGKHLLVEKPIGLNQFEAMAIIEAAIRNDVFLMEAFMYRCHPQTKKIIELIRQKEIGEVRVISATFSFHWPKTFDPKSRLIGNDLGGGGILDVGCYPVSMSRLIAGAAMNAADPNRGLLFADPVKVEGMGKLNREGTDDYAIGMLKFENEIVAQIATGVQVGQENVVRIYGSEGSITLPTPWVPAKEGGQTKIIVHCDGKDAREIVINCADHLYAIEADTVAANIDARQSREMSWDDTLGNMKTLDAWRSAIGLIYNAEKPENLKPTATKDNSPRSTTARDDREDGVVNSSSVPRTRCVRAMGEMKYGEIPHIAKKVSRLIIGCDHQRVMPHMQVLCDDFFARGGNCFDTAHIYGGGIPERLLGQWVKVNGIREQVVIIGKGAHTPNCNPKALVEQLHESLDRLQMSYVDLYLMHRDNPEIPVGEFVDVMNEQVKAGRMKAFGGSNWSLARVDEANEYARRKGLQSFSAVSNNFSLARMIEAPWAGCIASSDAQSRQWFASRKIPLLAWSSQARGFFLDPHRTDDPDLQRCWFSDDNFERRRRVNELAKKRGVLPINIALAYVLNQPFANFALIGPRTLAETRTTMAALAIELSADELKWLNLEG